jgi:hypothetical protein
MLQLEGKCHNLSHISHMGVGDSQRQPAIPAKPWKLNPTHSAAQTCWTQHTTSSGGSVIKACTHRHPSCQPTQP